VGGEGGIDPMSGSIEYPAYMNAGWGIRFEFLVAFYPIFIVIIYILVAIPEMN